MEAKCSSKAQQLSLTTINTLPPTIVESILCLLPIEEAARTSILSSEWRYKWTKIPKLVFSWSSVYKSNGPEEEAPDIELARDSMDRRLKLFYAIHQALLLRQGPIHEFTLVLDADCRCFEIDQILLHLSRNHSIKKLTLDFECTDYVRNLYKLPFCAFSLHRLTDLDLNYIDLNRQPATFGGFVNLRSLCLKNVAISTKALLRLLSNSPSLKSFTLLTEAENIGIRNCTFIELFKCLPVIEHLTISDDIFPWLVLDSDHPTSLVHLKYLCLVDLCFLSEEELSTLLAALIKCSPNLEKMKIVFFLMSLGCYNEECTALLKKRYSDVRLENLKEMEIEDFGNLKPEMELVKIILARSPKLKKLTITLSYIVDKGDEVKILKFLLQAPRASQVDIVVKWPQ